jgi:hypothetical protein
MNDFIFSSLVIAEIFLSILAFFTFFKRMALSSTASYCYSVILVMAIYSLFIQIFFLLHLQKFFYVFDICAVTFSSYQIWREQRCLPSALKDAAQFYKQDKFILLLMIFVWVYLFLQVLLLPPSNWDSMTYHLARVFMFQQEGSLFLKNFTRNAQATYPWGYDILSFLFLRFYSDYGLPIFSFLSYTTIVIGTYGLVNKIFKNASLSLLTCFMIASLKGIVLQATTTKNDIPCAAMSIVCFLAGYNFIQSSKFVHLYIMIVACVFGVSIKNYYFLFCLPFVVFYAFSLLKDYPLRKIMSPIISVRVPETVALLLPIGLIACFMMNVGNNLINYGNIAGETKDYLAANLNHDGILGCCINIFRYLLQSVDPPLNWARNSLLLFHDKLLGNYRFIACKNISPFGLVGELPHEGYAWYGPLGFFLIIPSILFTAWRGKGYIRIFSLSLLAFFLSLSYKVVWVPHCGRYLVLFFAGSGVCVAFLIQKISKYNFYKYFKVLILTACSISLLYAALFNVKKPFTNRHALTVFSKRAIEFDTDYLLESFKHPSSVAFMWFSYVINRTAYYDTQFTSKVVLNTFCNSITSGKRVLLIGKTESWVFPFFLKRPDLSITVVRPDHIYYDGKIYNVNEYDHFRFLKSKFDYILFCEVQPSEAVSSALRMEKQLFYVPSTAWYQIPITLYKIQSTN